MKKVLLLSPFFFPEKISSGKYNSLIARELVNSGYDVTVISSHPLYPSWKPYFDKTPLAGMTIKRGGAGIKYPKNPLLRRGLLELWFAYHVFCSLFNNKDRYDLVVPIFPPTLFMFVLKIFSKKCKNIVSIVHDLQGVHLQPNGSFAKKILSKLIFFIERYAFKMSDRVIYLSGEMRDIANKEYQLLDNRTHVAYPFVTINEFVDNGALNCIFDPGKKAIVYSGALGEKQNPSQLLSLAEAITSLHDDVVFYFFSEGYEFENLKEQCDNVSIRFEALVNEEDLPELLFKSHIQVLPQVSGSSSASLPSKLPNILASGTHLFVITDEGSEIDALLESLSNCVVSKTWDLNDNQSALSKMVSGSLVKKVNRDILYKFKASSVVELLEKDLL